MQEVYYSLTECLIEIQGKHNLGEFDDGMCVAELGLAVGAHDFVANPKNYSLDRGQKQFLQAKTFNGREIVDSAARLCVMNLYLHGIGGDSLTADPGDRFDCVITNPPFGKKSSITIVTDGGKAEKESLTYERNDFWAGPRTSNSTFYSTSRRCRKSTDAPPLLCPTMFCLKAAQAKRFASNCSSSATCVRSCDCRPGFFMRKVSE